MERSLPNIIGAIMTGLLTLLWTDLRKIRSEREALTDMIRASEEAAKKLALEVSHEIDHKYLPRETHALMCANVVAQMELTFGKMLKAAVDELKHEIRKNGNGG